MKSESGILQRDVNLELAFIVRIREQMWVTAIHQRRIASLPGFNRAAEIVHQRFAHQVFREVTPRLAAIVGADPRQNAQPRIVPLRLQIAEAAAGAYPRRLHVNIAAIKHKAFVIFHPAEGGFASGDLQRGPENSGIRHLRLRHAGAQFPVLHAAIQAAGKVFRSRQEFPLLPRQIAPLRLKARFLRRLQGNIESQQIDFAAGLRGAPEFAQRRRQLIGKRLQSAQATER